MAVLTTEQLNAMARALRQLGHSGNIDGNTLDSIFQAIENSNVATAKSTREAEIDKIDNKINSRDKDLINRAFEMIRQGVQ